MSAHAGKPLVYPPDLASLEALIVTEAFTVAIFLVLYISHEIMTTSAVTHWTPPPVIIMYRFVFVIATASSEGFFFYRAFLVASPQYAWVIGAILFGCWAVGIAGGLIWAASFIATYIGAKPVSMELFINMTKAGLIALLCSTVLVAAVLFHRLWICRKAFRSGPANSLTHLLKLSLITTA
ncbi:hypothetical protein MNV49_007887 [Pseudohyphozyma bogoriensis]|nr:hypothetical protein MNV49_007887 [Pseudohyphozyma bogoriensis]